jgi:hypothetical protein
VAAAGAAIVLVVAPVAGADPVWPVAGDDSAADTIADLEDQGYTVQINWEHGLNRTPLYRCRVTGINNPDRSGTSPPPQNTTVYVDVNCPSDDHDWGGIFGIGF